MKTKQALHHVCVNLARQPAHVSQCTSPLPSAVSGSEHLGNGSLGGERGSDGGIVRAGLEAASIGSTGER